MTRQHHHLCVWGRKSRFSRRGECTGLPDGERQGWGWTRDGPMSGDIRLDFSRLPAACGSGYGHSTVTWPLLRTPDHWNGPGDTSLDGAKCPHTAGEASDVTRAAGGGGWPRAFPSLSSDLGRRIRLWPVSTRLKICIHGAGRSLVARSSGADCWVQCDSRRRGEGGEKVGLPVAVALAAPAARGWRRGAAAPWGPLRALPAVIESLGAPRGSGIHCWLMPSGMVARGT